jgi:beta-galactosidase
VEEKVITTGLPAAIRLSVDRSIIDGDNRDVAHVKIEVVDENGNVVPDADELVKLTIEGVGSLIGFDNGNPTDHTSMKSDGRKTFNGLALAAIQSGNRPGLINIRASSPNIKGSSVEITVRKVNPQYPTIETIGQ